jgi:Domain of unknown function (DUF3387)
LLRTFGQHAPRGEETCLTDEEIAFYDALAENESAQRVMGEPTLRVIAHELVIGIKDAYLWIGCTARLHALACAFW